METQTCHTHTDTGIQSVGRSDNEGEDWPPTLTCPD